MLFSSAGGTHSTKIHQVLWGKILGAPILAGGPVAGRFPGGRGCFVIASSLRSASSWCPVVNAGVTDLENISLGPGVAQPVLGPGVVEAPRSRGVGALVSTS